MSDWCRLWRPVEGQALGFASVGLAGRRWLIVRPVHLVRGQSQAVDAGPLIREFAGVLRGRGQRKSNVRMLF